MQNVNELDLKLNVPYLTEMEIQLLVDKVWVFQFMPSQKFLCNLDMKICYIKKKISYQVYFVRVFKGMMFCVYHNSAMYL